MLRSIAFVMALAMSINASPIDMNSTLSERTVCRPVTTGGAKLVGNGNPHQNYIFKQVSGTTDCTGNPGGSAAVSNGQSVTWGLNFGGAVDFITGGFSVSETVSTGYTNGFGCENHSGSLCVFERIQVTAYTVAGTTCVEGCGSTSCSTHPPSVIFAPNSVQGSCFFSNYQAGLDCVSVGHEYHFNSGPAGGPQFITCEQLHPGA